MAFVEKKPSGIAAMIAKGAGDKKDEEKKVATKDSGDGKYRQAAGDIIQAVKEGDTTLLTKVLKALFS